MDKTTYIKGICIKDYRKFEKDKIYDIANVENICNIIFSYLVRYNNNYMDLVPKDCFKLIKEYRKERITKLLEEL